MCGINTPVARALAWCGWEVLCWDTAISPEMDISDRQVQARIAQEADRAFAAVCAMDCSTLTRAREKPIPGHPNPPQPMRSESHPYGLPHLEGRDKDRVEQANALIVFFASIARTLDAAGCAFILENPARSYIWHFKEIQKLANSSGWGRTEYDACALGGARTKAHPGGTFKSRACRQAPR